ncbi:uncharacterized protein LOC144812318 [Lissotriton helveticus]
MAGSSAGKAVECTGKEKDKGCAAIGGRESVLSKRGKLAAHVTLETREKIWKGDFVDIFSLIRPKRREVETKEKDGKEGSFRDRKPRVEESINNWLFGFNVFSIVMLEKKPELVIPLIGYANQILKAQTMYGGGAWLDYNRDFRWAKVDDPDMGWDQTEVNVWLESVNNKAPMKQPFRTSHGGAGEKRGACWAFNRKTCTWPPGACKFKHACAYCGHPSHPEFKCITKSKEKGREPKPRLSSKLPMPVDIGRLVFWLNQYPDRKAARTLFEGFSTGFRILTHRVPPVDYCNNLLSARMHPSGVSLKVDKERALGRVAGPFTAPPLPGFVCSPLGVVPKKEPGRFRMIHNLSTPRGASVNDAIDPFLCSVTYSSFYSALQRLRDLGPNTFMAMTLSQLSGSCWYTLKIIIY